MKRKLFAEVSEGFEALAEHRADKTSLRTLEGYLERIGVSVRLPAGGVRISNRNLTVGLMSAGSRNGIQEGQANET
jgi:hypothetical protein